MAEIEKELFDICACFCFLKLAALWLGVDSLEQRTGFWDREEGDQSVVKHWEKEGLQEQAGAGHVARGTLRDAGQEFNTWSVEQRP